MKQLAAARPAAFTRRAADTSIGRLGRCIGSCIGLPNRANRDHHGRARAGPRDFRDLGKSGGNYFLGGVWGEMGQAKGVPILLGTFFVRGPPQTVHWGAQPSTISCFLGPIFGAPKAPGPARAQFWIWGSKFGIRGPKFDPGHQKPKRCAPKNPAKPRLQNFKRSHMVQVMAKNHFGEARPLLDPIFRHNVPKTLCFTRSESRPEFESGSSRSRQSGAWPTAHTLGSSRLRPG